MTDSFEYLLKDKVSDDDIPHSVLYTFVLGVAERPTLIGMTLVVGLIKSAVVL